MSGECIENFRLQASKRESSWQRDRLSLRGVGMEVRPVLAPLTECDALGEGDGEWAGNPWGYFQFLSVPICTVCHGY